MDSDPALKHGEDINPSATSGLPRGARLLVLSQLAKALTLFAGLAILSRLLSPAEFGAVAVAVVIVGVGEIVRDMGMSAAAITQPNLQPNQRDLLFWMNVAVGFLLALGSILLAGPLGALLDNPVLSSTLPVLSMVFMLNGASAQYRADLTRQMKFTSLAITDSVAPLLGVLGAVVLALSGASYWALIAQQIVTAFISAALLIGMCRWLPRIPRKISESRSLVGFGLSVSWSQILGYLGNNVDTLALGYWAQPAQLGYYNRAFQVAVQPLGLIKGPLSSVAMPLLSRRRGEPARFGDAAVAGQRLVSYSVVPLAVLLAACASPVVFVVLGEQWIASISLIAVLAVAGAIQQLASVASWIFLAGNHGKALRQYSTVSLVVKVALVLMLAPLGVVPVALAYLGSIVLMTPVALVWAARASGVKVMLIVKGSLLRPVLVASFAGAFAWLGVSASSEMGAPLQLVLGILIFGATYGIAALIPAYRKDYSYAIRMLVRR